MLRAYRELSEWLLKQASQLPLSPLALALADHQAS
jgi:hypothetical protein